MTHDDFVEFFDKHGIRAIIKDDGNNTIMVLTNEMVPDHVKHALEHIRPLGTAIHYALRATNKEPVPTTLHKWYRETVKANK